MCIKMALNSLFVFHLIIQPHTSWAKSPCSSSCLYVLCVSITLKLTVLIRRYNHLLNPKLPYLVHSLPLVALYYPYTDSKGRLAEQLQTRNCRRGSVNLTCCRFPLMHERAWYAGLTGVKEKKLKRKRTGIPTDLGTRTERGRWVRACLICSVSPFDGIYGTARFEIRVLTAPVPDPLPVRGNLGKRQESLWGSLNEASSRLFCQMLATLQIKPQGL